jgi:hypothetical protein
LSTLIPARRHYHSHHWQIHGPRPSLLVDAPGFLL